MENIYKIPNLFSPEDLKTINDLVQNSRPKSLQDILGRHTFSFDLPEHILNRLREKLEPLLGTKIENLACTYADYRKEYGDPNLPPHTDLTVGDFMIDYQLKSNTSWGIGVETEVFFIEDNEALIFNPGEKVHWRPYKKFENEEYVGMIFFKFANGDGAVRHAERAYSPDHPIFDEAKAFRNSL
jgi:hypothetical protein